MATATIGEITPDALYTFTEIKRRCGIGGDALRRWRKDGLRVRYFGRHGYVRGEDIIAFIEANASDAHPTSK